MVVPLVHLDLRVGGKFRIQMKNADGEYFTAVGEFREVEPPERLVYTWDWEKEGSGTEFGEVEGNPVADNAAVTGTEVATYTRERPGMSAFALEDAMVYHTYSAFARWLDALWGMYQWLVAPRDDPPAPC